MDDYGKNFVQTLSFLHKLPRNRRSKPLSFKINPNRPMITLETRILSTLELHDPKVCALDLNRVVLVFHLRLSQETSKFTTRKE